MYLIHTLLIQHLIATIPSIESRINPFQLRHLKCTQYLPTYNTILYLMLEGWPTANPCSAAYHWRYGYPRRRANALEIPRGVNLAQTVRGANFADFISPFPVALPGQSKRTSNPISITDYPANTTIPVLRPSVMPRLEHCDISLAFLRDRL